MRAALEVCPDFGLPPKNRWRPVRVLSTEKAVRLVFVKPCVQGGWQDETERAERGCCRGPHCGAEPSWGPGDWTRRAQGQLVRSGKRSRGRGWASRRTSRAQRHHRHSVGTPLHMVPDLPHRGRDPRAPNGQRAAWRAALGQTSMGLAANGSKLASVEPPQPGPRCPHRDPSRLSAPRGVGVIRSLCLLLW